VALTCYNTLNRNGPMLQTLLNRLLPAAGIYRAAGDRIQRRIIAGVWYDADRCRSAAEAERIAAQLNSL
jgi:hypothetical protein